MKKVAVVYGGDSLEHDISIVTSLFVMEELNKHKISFIPIYISHDNTFYTGKALLNKDNYETKNKFIKGEFVFRHGYYQFKHGFHFEDIDVALLCFHGAGTEDGTIKALFDFMHIPSTSSSVISSALIQDKYYSKIVLRNLGIPVVDCFKLSKAQDIVIPEGFDFPLVIKPSHLGSSIGVKKVNNYDEYQSHLNTAFEYDKEVIVEKVVPNLKELNIAILGDNIKQVVSDIELVNMEDKVLTFKDKYELFQSKYSGHIIPARITKNLQNEIKEYATKAFKEFNCLGVVRFDFLYDTKNKKLYLNEINSIPGSLSYYLFKNQKITMVDIVNKLCDIARKEYNHKRTLITNYECSSLKTIAMKK